MQDTKGGDTVDMKKSETAPFLSQYPTPGCPKPSGCHSVPSKIPLPIDSKQISALA